jgi:hypothetical protein
MQEPSGERAEYQPTLDRKGNVGGHADEYTERCPDRCANTYKEPRSPLRVSNTHAGHLAASSSRMRLAFLRLPRDFGYVRQKR